MLMLSVINGFKQRTLLKLKLDLIDAALIWWLRQEQSYVVVDHKKYGQMRRINYRHLLEELPILRMSADAVMRRFCRLSKKSILVFKRLPLPNGRGSTSCYTWGPKYGGLVYDHLLPGLQTVTGPSVVETPDGRRPSVVETPDGHAKTSKNKARVTPKVSVSGRGQLSSYTTPTLTISSDLSKEVGEERSLDKKSIGLVYLRRYWSRNLSSLPPDVLKRVSQVARTHEEEWFKGYCGWYRKNKLERLGINYRLMFKSDMVEEYEAWLENDPAAEYAAKAAVKEERHKLWVVQQLQFQEERRQLALSRGPTTSSKLSSTSTSPAKGKATTRLPTGSSTPATA